MSDPNDPWAKRPETRAPEPVDQPTEVQQPLKSDEPIEYLHTDDPNAAYGAVPNPTLVYPTYESLREQQAQQPPYGWAPPGPQQPMTPPPPERRSLAMLIGMGIALGFLVAAVLGGGLLLLRPHNSGSEDSSGALPQQETFTQNQPMQPWPSATAPGGQSPDLNLPNPFGTHAPGTSYGATVGSVTSTDGATLSVQGVLGDKANVVHTNDQTKVLGVNREKVADLKVGDMVIVQGDKAADGSITARLIISTSLGN